MRWLGRRTHGLQSSDHALNRFDYLLRRPVSLAVLIIFPSSISFNTTRQINAGLALIVLFLVPITRAAPALHAGSASLYFLAALYALNGLIGLLDLEMAVRR